MFEDIKIIEITGDDAESFLQGQITAHLLQLPKQKWGISAYCLPNGRVFACFYLFKNAKNHFFLVLPDGMSEIFCQRLRKFTLRQAVKIDTRLDLHFFVLPPNLEEGFSFFTTGFKAVVANKDANLPVADSLSFQMARMRAGIPMIYPATSERFLPQMLNLQSLEGLSLTKGCYVGQEGVARVQYKTEIRRHLAFARVDSWSMSPKIGMSIVNEKLLPVGGVVDFVSSAKSGMIQAVIEDRYLGKSLTIAIENSPTLIFNT